MADQKHNPDDNIINAAKQKTIVEFAKKKLVESQTVINNAKLSIDGAEKVVEQKQAINNRSAANATGPIQNSIGLQKATKDLEQAKKYPWDKAATVIADLFCQTSAGPEREDGSPSAATSMPETSRTMHIYCDGGFGNRFNGLISGLIFAKEAGLKPIVVWPRNNWCGAGFSDLLTSEFDVVERELVSYVPEASKFQFFMTEDHLGMGVSNASPLALPSLEQAVAYLRSDHRNVYYHTPLIPAYLDPAEVLKTVKLN